MHNRKRCKIYIILPKTKTHQRVQKCVNIHISYSNHVYLHGFTFLSPLSKPSLSLSLSLFSLASLLPHWWSRSGRAWAHLDFLVVVRRLSSKDGCRFVSGKARYGFLLVGFGSFVEIHWWLYLQWWRNNGGWLIFCLGLIGGRMADFGFLLALWVACL